MPRDGTFFVKSKNLHNVYTVVKITDPEKVGFWSKGVASFYVNQKVDIHSPPPLWKTIVEKPVDNVENSELSTGIPALSESHIFAPAQ